MIAVSVDTAEDSKALAEKLSVTFPIIADTDRELTKAFGVYDQGNDIAWPAVFVVNGDGTVAWRAFEDNFKERVPIEEIVREAQKARGA